MHAQILLAAALVVALRLESALFVVTSLKAAAELVMDTLGLPATIPVDIDKDLS